jgi:hypothetical protein
MKTTIKDNILHIEIPLHAPRPSATGKTLTVASTRGNQPTEARHRRRQRLHQTGRLDRSKVQSLKVKE